MWADTLLAAERAHLLRLATWAMMSVVVGSAMLAYLRATRRASPLLWHFALQAVAWGGIDLLLLWLARGSIALRDLGGARSLERMLWLNSGLDAGYAAVGITLAIAGWVLGRRLGAVGAGAGIVVQGLALFVLDIGFASRLAALV